MTAHTITVSAGKDQGDGRHMVSSTFDGRVFLSIGLTLEDVERCAAEWARVAATIRDRCDVGTPLPGVLS